MESSDRIWSRVDWKKKITAKETSHKEGKKSYGHCTCRHRDDQVRVLYYSNVIMSVMASQITSLTIVYSIVYSGADHRKHQSSALLWSPVNSPHKGPVTRKMFPLDNVIMYMQLNSLWPSKYGDRDVGQHWPSDDTKPLPEPMLTSHSEWDSWRQSSTSQDSVIRPRWVSLHAVPFIYLVPQENDTP